MDATKRVTALKITADFVEVVALDIAERDVMSGTVTDSPLSGERAGDLTPRKLANLIEDTGLYLESDGQLNQLCDDFEQDYATYVEKHGFTN